MNDDRITMPHPVAALLTPEMKARVRAATFTWAFDDGDEQYGIEDAESYNCPFGVALGSDYWPRAGIVARSLKADAEMIAALIRAFDCGRVAPSEVKALLGAESEP